MTRVNTRSSQVREANERAQTEYVFEEPNQNTFIRRKQIWS